MKSAIKTRWVKALRSGEYKQGRYALKSTTGYCCLGVLTDLYCKMNKKGWKSTTKTEQEILPKVVMKWAGLGDQDPTVGVSSLASKNDHGMSFKRIAQVIEKSL